VISWHIYNFLSLLLFGHYLFIAPRGAPECILAPGNVGKYKRALILLPPLWPRRVDEPERMPGSRPFQSDFVKPPSTS
jgi:hypothetical protein